MAALGWVRFWFVNGSKNYQYLTETMPPTNMCGTNAPGWMASGVHPSVNDGIVSRVVCFNWAGYNCYPGWNVTIQVVNCGPYFLYQLANNPLPAGYLAYCTSSSASNVGAVSTSPPPSPPLAPPAPAAPPPPPTTSPPPVLPTPAAAALPVTSGLFAWYTASGWQRSRQNVWDDNSGRGRIGYGLGGSGISVVQSEVGFGARNPVSYVYGPNSWSTVRGLLILRWRCRNAERTLDTLIV